MKLGTFSHFGFDMPLEERLSLVSQVGFSYIFTYFDDAEELAKDHSSISNYLYQTFDLTLDSIHASYDNANLVWSDKESNRQEIATYYRDCINFCAKHTAPSLVIHPIKTANPPEFTQTGLKLFSDLVLYAEEKDVKIALENTRTNEYVDLLLSEIDSKSLGLCYDTSHDNLYGDPTLFLLDKWLDRLFVLHLSDNLGENDDHMLPLTGTFEWDEFGQILKRRNKEYILMMESFPRKDYVNPLSFLGEGAERLQKLHKMIG